jgi:hypothetical protein
VTPGAIGGTLLAVAVLVLTLAPPGYWLLLRLSGTPPRARDLALALALGFSTLLPLLWVERIAGAPVLVLPAVGLSVLALRREWRHWLRVPVGRLFVAMPLALALLAAWVDGGDVRWAAGGASIRMGFEVSDRAFYALVAQEVLRDPTPPLQNPVFAGASFAYSYFPALLGVLLHLYGGLDLLSVFQLHLPVVSFAFIALAVDRLLLEWGIVSRLARALTPLLCVLGGDLSFLFPPQGVTGGERSAHFIAFSSFSAESLYYNPWMIALPVVLATLVLAARFLREGGRGALALAAVCLAGLWQTKVFACLPLLLAGLAAGVFLRNRRLAALAGMACVLALPWAAMSLLGGDRTQPAPLRLEPLYPVGVSLSVHPSWAGLAALCGPGRSPLVRAPAAVFATLLVLCCGLGVRLLGGAVLARRARADATGFFAWYALTVVTALALGFLTVGNPVPLDGAQFLILPQLLLWPLTGPWLARALRAGPARGAAAIALLAASCASPLLYVARKAWPEQLTRPGAIDRLRVALSPDAVAAAGWLARQRDPARANLVADWRGRPGDPGGRAPLYLAAIAGKRLTAYAETFAVSEQAAAARRRHLAEVYATTDGARGEALLDALDADWVWADAVRPLRFSSPRLVLRAQSGDVRVLEFRGAPAARP